jgi:hypothetical protein
MSVVHDIHIDLEPYQLMIILRSRISEGSFIITRAVEESEFEKARAYIEILKKDISFLQTIVEVETDASGTE